MVISTTATHRTALRLTWALFGDGELTNLPGGIEQYLQLRAEQAKAEGTDENSMNLGGQGGDVEKTEKKETTACAQEDASCGSR